jgi:hypothetical protein
VGQVEASGSKLKLNAWEKTLGAGEKLEDFETHFSTKWCFNDTKKLIVLAGVFFFAPKSIQILPSEFKKRLWESRSTPTLA